MHKQCFGPWNVQISGNGYCKVGGSLICELKFPVFDRTIQKFNTRLEVKKAIPLKRYEAETRHLGNGRYEC